ncbi:MAG: 30S ribosome-binding factor RbfA [Candidatus Limnocylindrales bacterium]
MTQRTDRIDELLRQEIGQALEREITDPRIGFVTVTDVETVPDLSRARVWVSIIGTAEQRKESLSALRRAMPFIRRGLGSKIRLRRIPELEVRLDDSIERGTRVLRIINELEAGKNPADASVGGGESLPTPVARLPHAGDSLDEMLAATPPPDSASKPAVRRPRGGGRAGGKRRPSAKPTERRSRP